MWRSTCALSGSLRAPTSLCQRLAARSESVVRRPDGPYTVSLTVWGSSAMTICRTVTLGIDARALDPCDPMRAFAG
jgi:hypothetical protein